MKRVIYVLMMTMVLINWPSSTFGQKDADEDPVLKIFDKYEEKEGVESVTISPALLGLMKNGKSSDKKTQDLIAKISGLRILTFNDGKNGKGKVNRESFVAELRPVIKNDFEEIMKVKSSGERLELYVRKTSDCKDCKGALLFVTSADAAVTVMHLAGKIDKSLVDAVMNGDISVSGK